MNLYPTTMMSTYALTTWYRKNFKLHLMIKRGFKSKKKKNQSSTVPITDRVLEYFDLYYRPTYKQLWPSIRISLLTAKKSAAVINNFVGNNKYPELFIDKGAYDMVGLAALRQEELYEKGGKSMLNKTEPDQLHGAQNDNGSQSTVLDTYKLDNHISENDETTGKNLTVMSELFRKDLDVFVSKKEFYYDSIYIEEELEKERQEEEAECLSTGDSPRIELTALNNQVNIVKPDRLSIPEYLKVLTFPPGDVSLFPNVRGETDGCLYFYMLDGASVLPVIALDLDKGDSVLDLCAAPGGKSVTLLQTGLPGSLHCNDNTHRRVEKLKTFLNFCVPKQKQDALNVELTTNMGQDFVRPSYNKVLVDVPCNTDRHFVLTKENNLFSKDRARERLELPRVQKELLMSGIKSCLPGGNIVYSTCTLAPGQNDGTVQEALDEILRTTDIEVVVEDLQELVDIFKDTFKFYDGCRFGKLVIPSLLSNFGPMYISRLKRLK